MNDESRMGALIFFMTLAVFCGCLFMAARASEDVEKPERALKAAGYADIAVKPGSLVGEWVGCAKEEIAYEATATNVRGEHVPLLVCCGAFIKGCTVRSR
jgi:hypothetical protein